MSEDSLIQHGGWFAAAAVTLWGVILRVTLGRHYKAVDEQTQLIKNMQSAIVQLQIDMAGIRGQLGAKVRR